MFKAKKKWGIGLVALAAWFFNASSNVALADSVYPNRPIRVVVGYAAGGLTDVMTRMVAERMSRELGQAIVVENKPGAAATIAATSVAQAQPDGYTVLMATTTLAINPTLQPSLSPKNPMVELAPVGLVYESPFVLLVSKKVPVSSLAEFITYAKARPGLMNVAISGNGAVNHLILEMFNRQAGVKLTAIPYKGASPAIVDIHGGRLDATFATLLDAIPATENGAAKILAVTSRERIPALPEAPPIADTLPGFRGVLWQGLFAPAGTPEPIIARLASALRVATQDDALRAKVSERGVTLLTGGPSELGALLKSETEVWGSLIRSVGLKGE